MRKAGDSKAGHDLWGSEGDTEQELDQAKVQAALQKLRDAKSASDADAADAKGQYNSLRGDAEKMPSAEEMEAYRLNKERMSDPLADINKGAPATGGYGLV